MLCFTRATSLSSRLITRIGLLGLLFWVMGCGSSPPTEPTPDLQATVEVLIEQTVAELLDGVSSHQTPRNAVGLYRDRPDRRDQDIELPLPGGREFEDAGQVAGMFVALREIMQCQRLTVIFDGKILEGKSAADTGKLFFWFGTFLHNNTNETKSIQWPLGLSMLTPLGNEEGRIVGPFGPIEFVSEVSGNGYISPGHWFLGDIEPGGVMVAEIVFEAVNKPGPYYVILSSDGTSSRFVWEYVHDGLSDGC